MQVSSWKLVERFNGVIMCMVTTILTKDYGVIASDSASYDKDGKMTYESPKLFLFNKKYLVTYIGYADYLLNIDGTKFEYDFPALSVYLSDFLRRVHNERTENKRFCLFLLGTHNGLPVLLQLNSFNDFQPIWLEPQEQPVHSSIFYGEDDDKKKAFEEADQVIGSLLDKWKERLSPGILGEILTRGIYAKADIEEKLTGNKYCGGSVSVAVMTKEGKAYSLSNVFI